MFGKAKAKAQSGERHFKSRQQPYTRTDHVCKNCKRPILRRIQDAKIERMYGIDWVCSGCEKTVRGEKPDPICWCGLSHESSCVASRDIDSDKFKTAAEMSGFRSDLSVIGCFLEDLHKN